ncbi:MAG: hypothetical protein COB93_03975 [Sneathiella sp.]|nr:MAG: hypothetical protein COB93_03975 [Sneathiella sp.]
MKKEIDGGSPAQQITIETDPPRTLSIDYERYEVYLEGSDLTDVQKQEFIEALWHIIVGFVDLGFAVESTENSCGQNSELPSQLHSPMRDRVHSKDQRLAQRFAEASDDEDQPLREGTGL